MTRRHKRLPPTDWDEFTAYLLLTDDWVRTERVVGTHQMWKTATRLGPDSLYIIIAYATFYTRHWEWEFGALSRTEYARCEEILGKPTTWKDISTVPERYLASGAYPRSNVMYKKQQPQIERFRKFVSLWMELSAARREIHNILESNV